ncbi:hypothetical protein KC725_04535 [Candidatus Peregrinibacteria bacterium]|nr:hypothetical protein [Candidatus Peregrinibacteria bacterium]
MSTASNKMIGDFSSKPKTLQFFKSIEKYINALGSCEKTIKAQVSYSVKRKFLWLWAYEKTADGTLYMTVCLDKKMNNPHFHYVAQVSTNRWNHHVVVKSKEIAESDWLKQLMRAGFEFANK